MFSYIVPRHKEKQKEGELFLSCRQVWRLDSSLSWPVCDWKQNLSPPELRWPRSLDKDKVVVVLCLKYLSKKNSFDFVASWTFPRTRTKAGFLWRRTEQQHQGGQKEVLGGNIPCCHPYPMTFNVVIFVVIQKKTIIPVPGWSYIESWGGILSSVPPMQVSFI